MSIKENSSQNIYKRKTREEYLSNHNFILKMRRDQYNKSDNSSFMTFHNVIDLETYNPLGKNIEPNFSEITIQNLIINSIHQKKYLVLKIISKTLLVDSLNFIGEDSNKDAINVAIYDAQKYFNLKDWVDLENKVFSEGKYIIVIEPYYKTCSCPCGYDKLRIESSNEIIIFDNKEEKDNFFEKLKPENLSSENYKFIGNLMMKNKLYEKAIFYYEKAINECGNKNDDIFDIIIHSNLSEAYRKFGYFTKCLKYADYCLNKINELQKIEQISSNNLSQHQLKALYRKIKGLIGLRRFKESYEELFNLEEKGKKDIVNELVNFGEIKQYIDIIKEGKENNLGHYDFRKMLTDEKLHFNLDNYGDFLSPKVEIQFEKDKGIKINANENINTGELILVEKAIVFKEDRSEMGRISKSNLKPLDCNESSMTKEIDFYNKLAKNVSKYPLDNEKFYYLFDGNNLNEDINQRKKYIEAQVNGSIKLNRDKVLNVIFNNKYQIGRNFIFHNSVSIGIWGYASLLNNDCLPNTTYLGIGDFFILFSIKEIKKGEEITCRYNNSSFTFKDRQDELQKFWRFKCKCPLCEYQRKKDYSEYDNFIKRFDPQSNDTIDPEFIESFHQFLAQNEKNYNYYDLTNAYFQLEIYYSQIKNLNYTKMFSDFVSKYSEGNFLFMIANLYKVVLCILGSNDRKQFLDALQNIKNFLAKNTPFKNEEIDSFIEDNIKQFGKR